MHGILDYLETTAAQLPDKKALAYKDTSYTFRQLKEYSARLGAVIREKEFSGEPVGVFVTRGIETAVLFLAVVYSGNYYIPLDSSMPVSKLKAICEDAELRIILGDDKTHALLDQIGFTGNFLTMDDIGETETEAPDVDTDTPLYLIYTSGSTGKPKGVLKSHGAVISFIEAFVTTFSLGSDEIIGNQTPFFFDASAKDLYLMLKTGATMEVIPSEYFMLPPMLMNYIGERRVSYLCWVPTALSMVAQMNAFTFPNADRLRNVFFVGEVFPVKQLRKWLAAMPRIRYVNLYGSTELAGICCYYELGTEVSDEGLPMGKPLSNCTLTLRDSERIIQEAGILGEVCIESDALALCYYHDELRTADAFCIEERDGIEHRVFHSGDLARYDANGNLIFSSRKDFQIKHLGKRIELGEIESVADTIPDVLRCCCLYNTVLQQITLFCQLKPESTLDAKSLRQKLRGELSDYMVPQKVVLLLEMPYNANGKIDRVRLKELL